VREDLVESRLRGREHRRVAELAVQLEIRLGHAVVVRVVQAPVRLPAVGRPLRDHRVAVEPIGRDAIEGERADVER
jgi:hypothetical protein